MITVYQDHDENNRATWGQWFGTLSRDGHVVMHAGPFKTEDECRAWLGDVAGRAHIDSKRATIAAIEGRHGYNADAVAKAIAASNRHGRRIGAREAKAIHALLKGR